MWRHVKGYPANGQTTYTNSKTSKKNKILLNARLDQFYNLFGKKRRNIFPTLIQAEYNNRLWFYMWPYEWQQGQKFLLELVNPTKQSIPFDPVNLARGQTNGYVRVGAASKIGKAKKITKQGTVGLPIFFTKYIYADLLPESFPYKLSIADDLRKKMGKKKQKKTKIIVIVTKKFKLEYVFKKCFVLPTCTRNGYRPQRCPPNFKHKLFQYNCRVLANTK